MLTNMGPGRSSGGKAPKNVELEKKRDELREMVEGTPMWTVEELSPEKVEQLDQVVKQWESISGRSVGREIKGYDRIENLLSMWGKQESIKLEQEALALIQSGGANLGPGIKILEDAADRQRKVNARFPGASGKDMKRVMSIESEIKSLRAAPILAKVNEFEQKGKQAMDNGDAKLAFDSFQEAEKRLRELHVKYPNFSKAHVGRLSMLSMLSQKAESWDEIQRLKRMLTNADTVVRAGRFLNGAKMYQMAQKGLVKLENQSGGEIERMMETAEGGLEDAVLKHYRQEFAKAWEQVDQVLRQPTLSETRIWANVDKVRAVQGDIAENFNKYADSFSPQLERMEFLDKRKAELVSQIKNLRREFLDVPGKTGWKMLRCEVWQELYTDLLDVPNPSRNQGDQLPVESITIVEAQDFAKKASWLLGVKVVLPSQELFFAVAGSPQSANQISIVPLARMVPAKSGKTTEGGFYHLWGNVSEWIAQKDPTQDLAENTGGHFLDTNETVFEDLVRKSTIRDRSRSVGFRIAYRTP